MQHSVIDHFLVLGAGASRGARDGLPGHPLPPLGDGLACYLLNWLDENGPDKLCGNEMQDDLCTSAPSDDLWTAGLVEPLREFLRSALVKGFEKAAAALAPDLLEPVNRLLSWSMLVGHGCAFPEHHDRLDWLLNGDPFALNLAVITLNYDLLLEEALERAQRSYVYPGLRPLTPEPANPGAVPIYKLHGSINFLQFYGALRSSDPETLQKFGASQPKVILSGPGNGLDTQVEVVPQGGRDNLIVTLKHRGNARNPVLAIYAPGKPVPYNHNCVANIRDECLKALAGNRSAGATIIGVKLPEPDAVGDDPPLDDTLQALRHLDGGVMYIARGDEERARACELGFSTGARTLEEIAVIPPG